MSQDTTVAPAAYGHYEDEISITDLMLKLWRRRGLIVFLPLVLAGLTIAGLLTSKVSSGDTLSYYVELTGIKNNSYPNGAAFTPQDLLSPSVINQLSTTITFEDVGKIGEAIIIEYGTANSLGVLQEYQAALAANSKASPQDIALINERYESRLQDAARRGLKISVDYVALGLSKSQGTDLAYAIPRIWNQVFAEKFRIFSDRGILGLPVAAEVDLGPPWACSRQSCNWTRFKGINILNSITLGTAANALHC